MSHVVLLGDSIFDNASYVPGGPSVIEHLHRWLPPGLSYSRIPRRSNGSPTTPPGVREYATPG